MCMSFLQGAILHGFLMVIYTSTWYEIAQTKAWSIGTVHKFHKSINHDKSMWRLPEIGIPPTILLVLSMVFSIINLPFLWGSPMEKARWKPPWDSRSLDLRTSENHVFYLIMAMVDHDVLCIYTWKTVRTYLFCPLWVLPVTYVLFLFNCVFGFLVVEGCSNPLTTPGSDILRQSPKEEFQPEVEQNGSHHRVPKSGHKYCHISHQIWMYPKNTSIFQHHVGKKQ